MNSLKGSVGLALCAIASLSALPTSAAVVVTVNPSEELGPIKPLNGVNNGPAFGEGETGNAAAFRAARIPFARLHDSNACWTYGAPHVVDVSAVFPDFEADENDPKNYDFHFTDQYLKTICRAGTKPFFRLGQTIENKSKKYHVAPPNDFDKWARVCEHIIRHCNEGWADGHRLGIEYWEIWNEPDLKKGKPDSERPTWTGTIDEYHRFFRTAAIYLKGRFPNLKIGGPAFANVTGERSEAWVEDFFTRATVEPRVPLDFVSWHRYANDPVELTNAAARIRAVMDRHGYEKAESVLNEWNCIEDFHDGSYESTRNMAGVRGAAYAAAAMCAMQESSVDKMMYYDCSPKSRFNGLFEPFTQAPRKGYYAFYRWGRLSALGTQVGTVCGDKAVWAVAAKGSDGRCGLLISRYADASEAKTCTVTVRPAKKMRFVRPVDVWITDWAHTDAIQSHLPEADGTLKLRMAPSSFLYLEYDANGLAGL